MYSCACYKISASKIYSTYLDMDPLTDGKKIMKSFFDLILYRAPHILREKFLHRVQLTEGSEKYHQAFNRAHNSIHRERSKIEVDIPP